MFMSDALTADRPNAADPTPDRTADSVDGGNRTVLGLVRALIAYGKQLVDALQRRDPDPKLAAGFGPIGLASIIARVLRGLQIAAALEERLLGQRARRPAMPAGVADARPSREPSARKPREPKGGMEDPLDGRMPTAEEIAAQVRRRPVGAVLADICRDLGIGTNHPLWNDLRFAIMGSGGSVTKLLTDIIDRVSSGLFRKPFTGEEMPVPTCWASFIAAGTGPPP